LRAGNRIFQTFTPFTWSAVVTSGVSEGSFTFSGTAASDDYIFVTAESNSVGVSGMEAQRNELSFAGQAFSDVEPGEEFLLGSLGFINSTTAEGTGASYVELDLTIAFSLPGSTTTFAIPLNIVDRQDFGYSPELDADSIQLDQLTFTDSSIAPYELQIRFGNPLSSGFATDTEFFVLESQQGQIGIYGKLVDAGVPVFANAKSVTARMYPPSTLGGWFTPSELVTEEVVFDGVGSDNPVIAVDDSSGFTTNEDTPLNGGNVLANDIALDGGLATLANVLFSAQGATVQIEESGDFIYDPSSSPALQALPQTAGVLDTFTYTATDVDGDFDSATVTVMVTGIDDPPVDNPVSAVDDPAGFSTDDLTPLASGNLLDNDSALDGGLAVVAGTLISAYGARVNLDTDGTFTYNPIGAPTLTALADGETVADIFTYTATDADGDTDTAIVTVTVVGSGSSINNPVTGIP
jgi:VCBS repeat-containing protein